MEACAEASGTTSGGDLRSLPVAPVEVDAGATSEGTGVTFTDLYRDFFGPTGKATCAGDGSCHGGEAEPGALASGFICNADKARCQATMAQELVGTSGLANPKASFLYAILRKSSGGRMPKRPESYVFSDASLERIQTWIANGAKND